MGETGRSMPSPSSKTAKSAKAKSVQRLAWLLAPGLLAGAVVVFLSPLRICSAYGPSLLVLHPGVDTSPPQALPPFALVAGTHGVSVSPATPPQALGEPPFRLPKLIHQTVRNKTHLSCEQKAAVASWQRLNPDYTHRLWDDADIRAFVAESYPDLLPTPFDEYLSGAERSDLWRVLVVHKLGGVYADIDVECVRPVDEWNKEHGWDASLLLGLENIDHKRPHALHVNNWVFAGMPGHPLLAHAVKVTIRSTQHQFFQLAKAGGTLSSKTYEEGIIDRTGPAALSAAMHEYYGSLGINLNFYGAREVNSRRGVLAGGVRVLPIDAFASGWEVAAARLKGKNVTCQAMARDKPAALVCHLFWGTWRSGYQFSPKMTYGNC